MDVMANVKCDEQLAEEYFDLYMAIRQTLREGKMELSDAEAYSAYKEKLLTEGAKKITQKMIYEIK